MDGKYDIAIVGSGIAGATLATVLAKQGKKVIVFEAGSHPRFAVGESMILETSETLRALAELYDIPELAYYSSENYMDIVGYSHGVKRHFSFLHHEEEKPQDTDNVFQAVIPKNPHGHEMHLFRQDSDQFMVSVAISYGVCVKQNTFITDVDIHSDGVEVVTQEASFNADYIVDAGGFRSFLADKFKLRTRDLKTQSRSIFTHMIGVPDYHDVTASKEKYGMPFSVAEGTLHHIFKGGWLWVIPFNNHKNSTNPLCSVGLQLDPRLYPENKNLNAEQEFYQFIEHFPDMKKHLKHAKPVRNWVRTGRLQYSSKQVVGDRFALLGHAAGFVDPLFSKGLYVSFSCVSTLAHAILNANGDFSAQHFKPYENTTLAFIAANDRLVANSYKSFGNYKLWSVYLILWLLGAYTEYIKLLSSRTSSKTREEYYDLIKGLHLEGGGFREYDILAEKTNTLVEQVDITNSSEVNKVIKTIKSLFYELDWLPKAFRAALDGKTTLPKSKLRLGLLRRNSGFMGKGEFRKHFFNDATLRELVKAFICDKKAYSQASVKKISTRPRLQAI